jgi:Holliday junction resolvasome RuvABC endonuclease subunit
LSELVYRFIGIDVSTKKIAVGIAGAHEAEPYQFSWVEVEAAGDHMGDRFRGLVENFRAALEQLRPVDMAFVEDITFTRGRQTELGLAKVLGAVEAHLLDCGIPYMAINNATWRSALGLAGRKGVTKSERKARSIEYMSMLWNVRPPNHDIADALCVLSWGLGKLIDPILGGDPKVRELVGY